MLNNIPPIDLITLPLWIKVFEVGGTIPIAALIYLTRNYARRAAWADPIRTGSVYNEIRVLVWGPWEWTVRESVKFRKYAQMGKWKYSKTQ